MISVNKAELIWRERASKSEFVTSVWFCSASAATTRSVLADPCISIAIVKEGDGMQVVLRGPETKPRSEVLVSGYRCLTIRLRPGVIMQGFSAQTYINSSLTLPVDVGGRFWFGGSRLQFSDFDNAELLIDQLYNLGFLCQGVASGDNAQATRVSSARTYSRLIKRTTGLSPYRLHQLQRIHQALRLLKQGMPAATVATELHFVDQAHLTHVSKQFLGHTPKQLLYLPQIP